MSREQFLAQLRRALTGLRPDHIAEIIADYESHFTDGAAAGRSEADIAAALGDPRRLARELRADYQLRSWEENRTPGNFFSLLFSFLALAAIDFVILLPLLMWAAGAAFAFFAIMIGTAIEGLCTLFGNLQSIPGIASGIGLIALAASGMGFLSIALRWGGRQLLRLGRLHYRLLNATPSVP